MKIIYSSDELENKNTSKVNWIKKELENKKKKWRQKREKPIQQIFKILKIMKNKEIWKYMQEL